MGRDDVYLFSSVFYGILHDFHYLVVAHQIWIWIFTMRRKCAKFTDVSADICRIYMAIYIKKDLLTV